MRYLPVTEKEKLEMLQKIGVKSIDDLFAPVPESVRLKAPLNLPKAKSEPEIEKFMATLAKKNSGAEMLSFLGSGCYNHHCPSLIDQMLLRSEFFTAYTPYQPEISQGTLRAIFEFQTMTCNLFKMEVANASMYDGATAAAEAVLMAARISPKKKKIAVAATMHPHYIATVKTFLHSTDLEIVMLDMDAVTGAVKASELSKIDENTACVLFQYPNWFGVIENVEEISKKAKALDSLVIPVITEATSMGILKAPGDFDADIAVGEGQALGIPLNFGGPGVGLFTTKEKHARKMPGRLVGKTVDKNGNECFVLTLSAREQHIKREKATSNICSNQALMGLAASMYMATMGKTGLKTVALMNLKRKDYMAKKIQSETKAKIAFTGATYNEFAIALPIPAAEVVEKMAEKGILAGVPASKYYPELSSILIVNTTEIHSYEDIDRFAAELKAIIGG